MVDKLVQPFIDFISLAKFWFVIEPYEIAVVTTLGRPTRDIGPVDGWFRTGFHLILPLKLEVVEHISIQKETTALSGKDIETTDNVQVRVDGMFVWHVRPERVREYVFGVGDEISFVADLLQAAIATTVAYTEAKHLNVTELEPAILEQARKFLNPFGLKIHSFHFVSLVRPGRSYRLITGG